MTSTVTLNSYLLRIINNYLDNNIDRVFLVLTCKDFFENRHNILHFKGIDNFYQAILQPVDILYNRNVDFVSDLDHNNNNNNRNECQIVSIKYSKIQRIRYDFTDKFYNRHLLYTHLQLSVPIKAFLVPMTSNWNNLIPEDTTHLYFEDSFNMPIVSKKMIPSKVCHIVFGYRYNQMIKPRRFPSSVRSIQFGHSFDQELNISNLPEHLEYLSVGDGFSIDNLQSLPSTLHSLRISGQRGIERVHGFNKLYRCIEEFTNANIFSLQLDFLNKPPQVDKIPKNVKNIHYSFSIANDFNPFLLYKQLKEVDVNLTFSITDHVVCFRMINDQYSFVQIGEYWNGFINNQLLMKNQFYQTILSKLMNFNSISCCN